jgi:hypothetical protein
MAVSLLRSRLICEVNALRRHSGKHYDTEDDYFLESCLHVIWLITQISEGPDSA